MEKIIRNETKEEMKRLREQNKNKLKNALITRIPATYCYYNSVNIAVGRQNSGKTDGIIEEIINISKICPNTHMLIYTNKTGLPTDTTFETLKEKIQIPIRYVSHDNLEEYLQEFLMWKQFYKEVREQELYDQIHEDQLYELFDKLQINDFESPFLHTLILMDDVAQAKILKNKKTYIQEMMTQCRHINCSFFLTVQFWGALTTNIKENVSTIFLFGGYSRKSLSYIFSQTNTPIDIEDFWNMYRSLKNHEKIIIDSRNNTVEII